MEHITAAEIERNLRKYIVFHSTIERVFRGRKLVKEQAQKGSAIRCKRYGVSK